MSISEHDFEKACSNFQAAFQRLGKPATWEKVTDLQSFGTQYLQIIRKINVAKFDARESTTASDDDEAHLEESDDEALIHSSSQDEKILVIYDVVYSPTYQVPVLYMTLKQPQTSGPKSKLPLSLDEVYSLLVPPFYKAGVEAVGVMGALSMTDHPVDNVPAYFVHPCRTAEAMEALTGGKAVKPAEYLMMWLGLVGPSVGLEVPLELAVAMSSMAQ